MNSGFTAYRIRARVDSMASTCASTSRATGASFCRLWMSSRSFSSWVPGRPSPPVTSSPADREGDLLLLAPDLELRVLVGREEADGALEIARPLELLAVELEQDVAALDAGLGRGAVRYDLVDEHALRLLGTELAREVGRERLDRDAEPAADHAALVAELRVDLARHVGRDRKADARAARDDRGVDADHLGLQVHERPAGISWVDRGVGLEEVVEGALTDLAGLGADDPRRHRGLQAERRADGDHPVADADLVRVAQSSEAKIALAVVQLEHGEVGLLVQADDLRLVLAAVERDDLDVGRPFDDMGVGERDARRVHDDAGAQAPLGDAFGDLAEEATVEFLTEELLEGRPPLEPARHRVDVDHGGLDRVRDGGERAARQRHLRG